MIGTIRWNLVSGTIGFVITFMASINSNIWFTSLLRGVVAFVAWFALCFLLRYAMGTMLNPQGSKQAKGPVSQVSSDGKGRLVDLKTPDESDSLQDLLRGTSNHTASDNDAAQTDGAEQSFQPLKPPKLVSKQPMDAEQLAQAVRHLAQK
ncbi:hypothetical protein [Paenibacillus sp. 481]|uniref:hypothetical protein n=1 Tax=Paenibacillus sp. 481 TaxID=2835869 RepID=UPI001E460A9C|nr:hypothetical protein [Paenibacillus sp. 481]UHA73914.1 hypothetical protein KIK04_01745 [Paenibacillus sp. 481]